MVYHLPFLSYLSGYKSVPARPSDPDMITNITLEATASSIVKNACNTTNVLTTKSETDLQE